MSMLSKLKAWLVGDAHITQSAQSIQPTVATANTQNTTRASAKHARRLTSAQVDLIKSLNPQAFIELRDEVCGGDMAAIARTARTHAAKAFGRGGYHVLLVPKRGAVMVYRMEKK